MCCPYALHLMLGHEISYLIHHISLLSPSLGSMVESWGCPGFLPAGTRKTGWAITPTSYLSSATPILECCPPFPKVLIHTAPEFMTRESEAWRNSLTRRNTAIWVQVGLEQTSHRKQSFQPQTLNENGKEGGEEEGGEGEERGEEEKKKKGRKRKRRRKRAAHLR